jgi:hypothetical protein
MNDSELEAFFYNKYIESYDAQREAGLRMEQGYAGITHPVLYNSAQIIIQHNRAMLFAMRAVETETAERSALVVGDAESPESVEFAALIREEFGI